MTKLVFGLIGFILLGGCSLVRDESLLLYRSEDVSSSRLAGQKTWGFEGRIILINQTDSISGSISWLHERNRDEVGLVGPLSQGRMMISIAPDSIEINDGDSVKKFSGSIDLVMGEQLGVDLPVGALRCWVLGMPEPDIAVNKQDEGFYQQGWGVKYKEMQRVKDLVLPKKIWIEKDHTRIKLIIDHWDFW